MHEQVTGNPVSLALELLEDRGTVMAGRQIILDLVCDLRLDAPLWAELCRLEARQQPAGRPSSDVI
ncbi:hypothetical protein J6590_051278 [Homalodisca vitripennis]|nr:hypothetical protein J6590_051278 [Homalodisca vitripennis]